MALTDLIRWSKQSQILAKIPSAYSTSNREIVDLTIHSSEKPKNIEAEFKGNNILFPAFSITYMERVDRRSFKRLI
jgi:5'(3')-deoxyribonucleotidase